MGQCEPGPVQLVEPDHVIGGMRRLLNRAKPDHVELALALNAPGRQVSLPAGALELILLNLLIGGSEGLPKGAGVRLTTDSRALRYHLSLENNGPGIPEGQLRRMLEPRTSLPASGGLMGLTVLHNLVSRVGGQIDVKSVPGKGVVIDVSLEVTQAEPKTPPPPHAPFDATIRGDGKTILLCENDEVLRDVMAATLVEQGYGVVACADGARGLALIDSNADLDAVITDLVMPNAGGAEVALACNLRGRSTPVVFISGHLDRDALPELGAPNEFLAKPFRMNDLLAALQVVLANVSR